jgi:hypothetical protein
MKMAKRQSGMTIIEFTVIAWGLLVLVFFAFEIGRYMFSMQMLNEMTRKAARLATVCAITDQADIPSLPEVVENRPSGFAEENLVISYVDSAGSPVSVAGFSGLSSGAQAAIMSQIRYVSAEISGFQFQFFPLLAFIGNGGAVDVPSFKTLLPVESLGIVRPNTGSTNGTIEDC